MGRIRLKSGIILFFIIILSLLIRLPATNQAAAIDEDSWLLDSYWEDWHPPVSVIAHGAARTFLGETSQAARLLMLTIGTINIVLVFFLTRILHGKNSVQGDKAGLFAAGLMAFSAYPTLAALQIDIDGSFLLLFYLITSLSYVQFLNTNKNRWLIATGIGFGLCMLTKYSGIFIIPIIALTALLSDIKSGVKPRYLGYVKEFLVIGLIGLVIFSIYPLSCSITGSDSFLGSIGNLKRVTTSNGTDYVMLAIQYMLAIMWIGPLFIGLFVLSLTKLDKKNILPYVWIAVIIFAYTFLNQDNYRPIDRYFLILIAPLSIIGGSMLERIKLDKKLAIASVVCALAFFASFFFMNTGADIMPFYPKDAFIHRALSLDWNFYVPFAGSSGPLGFYIQFGIIALAFLLAALSLTIILVCFITSKNEVGRLSRVALICFLSVSAAYGFIMIEEHLYSMAAPSVDKTTKSIISYAEADGLQEPVYVFRNKALRYYLRDINTLIILDFWVENDATRVDEIVGSGVTVIVVDFPKINEDSLFWKGLNNCERLAVFEDKGVAMGYVFSCPGNN